MATEEHAQLMRIGELSRRTGVSTHVLRSWERRYGLLDPARTDGGFRLYSDADERRIRAMQHHIAEGYSASAAARVVAGEPPTGSVPAAAPPVEDPTGLAAEREALRQALVEMDEVAATAQLDRIFSRYSLGTALDGIVIPYLADLGERWARGESSISEEHFATFIIRGRLVALARGWGLGGGPLALIGCAPEEDHDLGLICFGLGLREQGWRIVMLGANTPIETFAASAAGLAPDLVVVNSMQGERLERAEAELRRLAAEHRVLLAGAGAGPELARRVGAEHLRMAPVTASRAIAAGQAPGATTPFSSA